MSNEVKEKLQSFRDKVNESKTEEQLAQELGPGVEQDPLEVDAVDLESLPSLDLSSADEVREIFDELEKLPSIKEAGDLLKKHDAYNLYARKIWKMKQSERESFPIRTRVVEKIEKVQRGDVTIEKIIWKRDPKTRQILTRPKTFWYSPVTIQEKDEFIFLEGEKQSAHFAVIEEGAKIDKIIAEAGPTSKGYADYAKDKTWEYKYQRYQQTIQEYWIAIFKAYFGATDEDIKTLVFDDIVNYSEVALYKGGVKSPK